MINLYFLIFTFVVRPIFLAGWMNECMIECESASEWLWQRMMSEFLSVFYFSQTCQRLNRTNQTANLFFFSYGIFNLWKFDILATVKRLICPLKVLFIVLIILLQHQLWRFIKYFRVHFAIFDNKQLWDNLRYHLLFLI